MKASKIVHKREERIKIDFPFNQEIVSKIRQIPDARWSKTHGAWHVPFSKDAYNQLIRLFPDIEISKLRNVETSSPTISTPKIEIVEKVIPLPAKQSFTNINEITIELSGKSIVLKMPKNETDIQFIRTFQKRHLLLILNAKGKKDRVVPISDKVITMLREYYKMYKPKIWLFEGQNAGEQYSDKSIQSVLKDRKSTRLNSSH